jgi:hypothetical protein
MPIETQIANFTANIKRGAPYLPQITFDDADDNPVATLDASFFGVPDGAAPFTWDAGNGKFINIGVGTYRFNLTEAETSAITWEAGTYHIQVVDASGFTFPYFLCGLMFIENC